MSGNRDPRCFLTQYDASTTAQKLLLMRLPVDTFVTPSTTGGFALTDVQLNVVYKIIECYRQLIIKLICDNKCNECLADIVTGITLIVVIALSSFSDSSLVVPRTQAELEKFSCQLNMSITEFLNKSYQNVCKKQTQY